MKVGIVISRELLDSYGDLLDNIRGALKEEIAEVISNPNVQLTFSYDLKWDDLGGIAKRMAAVRALAEQGKIGFLEGIEETQEALYYLDCIREDMEVIRKITNEQKT